jgi:phosphopantothenoylcysteine decarboxylase/phosphopantothenate--cysteine ligase
MLARMKCLVTAGPTYEPLDQVRRLTNFSTGKLGTELANFLTDCGHEVKLLLGEQATWAGKREAGIVQLFSTTTDLETKLRDSAFEGYAAVFHAAAVSDFGFGTVWERDHGELRPISGGKIPSRTEGLVVELRPTRKLIRELRDWYPQAILVGWKYEVDGSRAEALQAGERQIRECRTNACVVNGPAYGLGFGLVTAPGANQDLAGSPELFSELAALLGAAS